MKEILILNKLNPYCKKFGESKAVKQLINNNNKNTKKDKPAELNIDCFIFLPIKNKINKLIKNRNNDNMFLFTINNKPPPLNTNNEIKNKSKNL